MKKLIAVVLFILSGLNVFADQNECFVLRDYFGEDAVELQKQEPLIVYESTLAAKRLKNTRGEQ